MRQSAIMNNGSIHSLKKECLCYIHLTLSLSAVLSLLILTGYKSQVDESKPTQTVKPKKAQFVERQLCIDCHEVQYKEWISSP